MNDKLLVVDMHELQSINLKLPDIALTEQNRT